MEGDLTWGGEHTIQYIDDVLQNCIPETCIILLTNITQINSIKKQLLLMKMNYMLQSKDMLAEGIAKQDP